MTEQRRLAFRRVASILLSGLICGACGGETAEKSNAMNTGGTGTDPTATGSTSVADADSNASSVDDASGIDSLADGSNAGSAVSSDTADSLTDAGGDTMSGDGGSDSVANAADGNAAEDAASGDAAASNASATDADAAQASSEGVPYANVSAVAVSGSAGSYNFNVSVESTDIDCSQFADWWEVLNEDGELLYRRILDHPHTDENCTSDADAPGNTFTRSGGPVDIAEDQIVYVRAHISTGGYTGVVFVGSVADGFSTAAELADDFAASAETAEPLPTGCYEPEC